MISSISWARDRPAGKVSKRMLVPQRIKKVWERPLSQTFVMVVLAYAPAVVGLVLWNDRDPLGPAVASGYGSVIAVTLFTVTHGAIPLFCYARAIRMSGDIEQSLSRTSRTFRAVLILFNKCHRAWFYVHAIGWYGVPTIFLSYWTGGTHLPLMAVHIVLAPRAERLWRYFQYGTTNLAALLAVGTYASAVQAGSWGGLTVAILAQCVPLTIIEYYGRKVWVKGPDNREKPDAGPCGLA